VSLILMAGAEGLSIYTYILFGGLFDYFGNSTLSTSERMSEINTTMVLVLILHFSGAFVEFLLASILASAGERVVARLRNRLFSAILQQEIAFFDSHKTGELASRLGSDTTLLQLATTQALPVALNSIVELFATVGIMFWISSALTGVTLGIVFVIFIICVPFAKYIGALSKTYQDILGQAQTHSTEALGAMRTVHSFVAEDREIARYKHVIGEPDQFPYWLPSDFRTHQTTYSVGFVRAIASSSFTTFASGFVGAGVFASLWYGFKLVNDGMISLGKLVTFYIFIAFLASSLQQLTDMISQLIQAYGVSGRIFYLLEREPEIPKLRSTSGDEEHSESDDEELARPLKVPSSMEGAIDFNNVQFSYPSRPNVPVLQNISLSIAPNTTAALVGSSGAGKSTVVALMQRFYDVASGSITIDGNDIRDLDLKWLRSNIGYVQQEPQLFGMTIRENVTYGVDREVTSEELENVCRKANAHEFIVGWPKAYETLVGERGVKLSGGQKQRLAIARALLVDPRILLLDEATSALDAESEHLVQEAINKAVVGRTVIIVAHRLSTIQRASQIVVIDEHEIVDVGTYCALLERCTKYQDLIKRQSIVGKLPPDSLASIQDHNEK